MLLDSKPTQSAPAADYTRKQADGHLMTIWETIFLFNTITRHSERSEESTTKDAKTFGRLQVAP